MAKKIPISFKETTKDLRLYTYIMSLEDRSTWVKEVLRKAMEKEIN